MIRYANLYNFIMKIYIVFVCRDAYCMLHIFTYNCIYIYICIIYVYIYIYMLLLYLACIWCIELDTYMTEYTYDAYVWLYISFFAYIYITFFHSAYINY